MHSPVVVPGLADGLAPGLPAGIETIRRNTEPVCNQDLTSRDFAQLAKQGTEVSTDSLAVKTQRLTACHFCICSCGTP
jgi:hypothetical protein